MRNGMKLLILTMLTISFTACATTSEQPPEAADLNAIVATVDGVPIKKAEYKQELNSTYQRFHQSGQMIDGSMYEQLKTEVVESLINLIVMDRYGQSQGIEVDDARVEELFQEAVAQYASKRKYEQSLKEACLTEVDIRTRLTRALRAQKVVQTAVSPNINVAEDEIRAYYNENTFEFEHDVQVHAAHILIQVKPFDEEEDRQKAKQRILEIQEKIKVGEDFAELAKKYSEGPSKVNGGDLGFFGTAQMAPAFETAAFSLNPGEVSDVVSTQFGYHLIKCYQRKPAGKESFEEVAPRLKARFYKERLNNALRQFVDQLKSKAKIERFALD